MASGKLDGLKDVPEAEKQSILQKIVALALQVGVTLAIPGAYVRYQSSDIKQMENVLGMKPGAE